MNIENRLIQSNSGKINIVTLVSYCLPILFFLKQYAYGFGNIYLTGAVLLCALCFLASGSVTLRFDKARKALMLFTLFYVGRLALTAFGSSTVNRAYLMMILQYFMSAFVIIVLIDYIDEDKLYKMWKFLCIIVGIAIMYQSVQIYILGHNVYPINVLPPTVSSVTADVWHRATDRPVAFFTEPSCISAFITPVLFLALRRKEVKFAFFLTVMLLLSASTTALVGAAFIWLTFILSKNVSKGFKQTLIIFFVLLCIALFVLPVFSTATDKLLHEVSGDSIGFRSRVTNGWVMYGALDFPAKIIGADNIDLSAYIRSHSSLLAHASQTRTENGYAYFFNTSQRIGLTSGIIGLAAYAWMLSVIYRSLKKDMRPFFWLVVIELFYGWNFYTSNYFMIQMFVIFIVGGSKDTFLKD